MGTSQRRRKHGNPRKRRGCEVNKYTPGPWELRGTRLVTDKHGVVIAEKIGSNGGGSESNARLIASAPELLEALEALLDDASSKNQKAARDAIAKAKGEA